MKHRIVHALLIALLLLLFGTAMAYADDGTVSLSEGVAWVLSGGGAGVVTYFLVGKVSFLKSLAPDYKRYASIVVVLILTAVAWGFGMLMGYMPTPETWQMWIEVGFSTAFVALTTSLILHGSTDLRQKRLNGS